MSNLLTSGRATTRYSTTDDGPTTGRHAFNEDAVLTPIFHALLRGGRGRQSESRQSESRQPEGRRSESRRAESVPARTPGHALRSEPAEGPPRGARPVRRVEPLRGLEPPRRVEPSRRAEPDPVDVFRRDPLTAPIPVQALVPAPTASWRRRAPEAPRAERGRHHRRLESVGADRSW